MLHKSKLIIDFENSASQNLVEVTCSDFNIIIRNLIETEKILNAIFLFN